MLNIKTDRELAYAIQGFFEISGSDQLTREQAKAVLDMAGQLPKTSELAQFMSDTVLDYGAKGAGPIIARHLADVFHHDIDPSYDGDQQDFQQIHDGDKLDLGPMRC